MLQKWGFRQNGLFLTNLFIFLDKVKILKSKNSLDVQIRLQIKNSTVLAQNSTVLAQDQIYFRK